MLSLLCDVHSDMRVIGIYVLWYVYVCVVFLCSGFEIWIEKCMYVQDFLVYITLSMVNEQ